MANNIFDAFGQFGQGKAVKATLKIDLSAIFGLGVVHNPQKTSLPPRKNTILALETVAVLGHNKPELGFLAHV